MRVKRKDGLTDKQNKYCLERAKGKTRQDAYKAAYNDKGSTNSINANSYNLEKLDLIKAKIEYYRKQAEQKAVLELEDITAMLTDFASDDDKPDGIRLKALDQLTRMKSGYNDNNTLSIQGNIGLSQLSDSISDLLE